MKASAAIAWLETLHPDSEVDVTARPPAADPIEDLFRPATAAERARDYRKRKKGETVTPTVTKNVTVRDGGVRGGSALGSEKEAEKEGGIGSTCQVDLGATVTKSVTRHVTQRDARRWRRVPTTWEPNDAHRAISESRHVDFDKELAAFRDHEFAAPKRDADAAFRNWLRRATPDRHGARDGFKSAGTLLMERAARLGAKEESEKQALTLFGGTRR